MKKSDIAMIILIAFTSILVAYFVTKNVLGSSTDKPVQVDVAEKLSSDITPPDKTIFNKDAINPAVKVTVGAEEMAPSQ